MSLCTAWRKAASGEDGKTESQEDRKTEEVNENISIGQIRIDRKNKGLCFISCHRMLLLYPVSF
jgi:hypothetical protein